MSSSHFYCKQFGRTPRKHQIGLLGLISFLKKDEGKYSSKNHHFQLDIYSQPQIKQE